MLDFFKNLFNTNDYMPRWVCGEWSAGVGWLHVVSDIAIFASYFTIPVLIVYFIWKRKDIPFFPILWLFAAFILLCGLGHLIEASIFWNPWYRLSGLVKAMTAVVSVITALVLVRLIPQLMNLPSQLELKAQKKWMEHIMNKIPAALFILDVDLKIKYVNDRALNKFRYDREELERRSLLDLISSSARKKVEERLKLLFDGSLDAGLKEGLELMAIDSRHDLFPVEFRASYIKSPEGKPMLICDIYEIEEKYQSRTRLESWTQELERSNKDLDSFAYVASHDLKSPLRGIANLVNWVKDDLEDGNEGEAIGNLNRIKGRIGRMDQLLDDLLEYSKIGRSQSKIEEFSLKGVIEEVQELHVLPTGWWIDVKESEKVMCAYKTPLHQVLRNLLDNAIKHNRDIEGVSIEVNCEDHQSYYEISFRDSGKGIPKNFQDKVFSMCKTLESRDKVEGSGIGLAVVKKIVEMNGGKIELESEEGKGTEFRFTWKKHNIKEQKDVHEKVA